ELAAAALVVGITGVPDAIVIAPATVAIPLGAFAPPLAVLWIVTLTNAVNMTDVVDGVAGGVGAISAAALGLTSLALGHVVATAVLFGLAGALVGFLPHNFRTPRIFLGDSGSLLVGFLLGVASLVGLERGGAWLAWPAVLAVSVPRAECGLTVTRRLLLALAVVRPGSARERFLLRRGRAGLFVPDRRHVPHRLRDMGFAPWTALALLYGAALGTGALAVAAVRWPAVGPPAVLLALAGVLYIAPRWLYEELRLFDRGALLPLLETRVLHNHVVHVLYDAGAVAGAFRLSRALAGGPPGGGARLSFRILESVYQRSQLAGRRALIFGADRSGRQALAEMLSRPELGLRPVGFVDDDPRSEGADFQGYPVRAVSDGELAGILRSLDISDLVVPVGSLSPARLVPLGELCREHAVRLLHFGVRWDAGDERVPARV